MNHSIKLTIAAAFLLTACSAPSESTPSTAEPGSVTADVWVDNWFEMYVNGTKVIEDSVPITTERSFNAETVTFPADRPMTIAILAKDFKENDSGLEYIGTNRQQMGDGGMIAQFRDASTGQIVAVTDKNMRCKVVHRAPLDKSCANESNPIAGEGACAFEQAEIPDGWTAPDFDDSAWPMAVEYAASAVRPKDGYDEIEWDNTARLIWSDDLEQDNSLLCRMTVEK